MEENKSLDTNKKVKRRVIIGSIVLILLNVWSLLKINSLQRDMENMQSDIGNLYSKMNTSMSSINTTIEETLKKQGSILSDFSYSEEGLDIENKAINLTLKGTPKIYKEGLKFYFTYTCSNGDSKSAEGKLDKDLNYSAKIAVPLENEVKFAVTLDYGDEVKKEICVDDYRDKMEYQLQLVPKGFSGDYETKRNEVIFNGKIESWIYPSKKEGNYVVEPLCNVKINDEVVDEFKLEQNNQVPSEYSVDFNKSYKLNEGDRLDIFVEVYDTYGFNYKYCAMTIINWNGKINKLDFSGENGVVKMTP